MMRQPAAAFVLFLAWATTAAAAQTLPAVKASSGNQVPACATPGRMNAFLKLRNASLAPRFDAVATEYMRHGETLGVRWDYAFFQMLLETGNLSFRRGDGRQGDVGESQNNFAGLGATGRGVPGERFPDISTGVKAHLEHLLIYAGERVIDPVAERTRKVQEWGILTSWRKGIKGDVTFADLSRKWAPSDRTYAASLVGIAKTFFSDFCGKPDPRPELVAEARAGRGHADAKVAAGKTETAVAEAERRRRAAEQAWADGGVQRSGLGATAMAGSGIADAASAKPQPGGTPAGRSDGKESAKSEKAGGSAVGKAGAGAAAAPKCRVWTASYGGQKAIIIKAVNDDLVNYTVLDVNDGAEKREAEAYIAAYARGGQTIAEFATQTHALDRAFELCPEG